MELQNMYYKAIESKISGYYHRNRHINQWKRIGSPERNSHIYSQIIFDKNGKNTQWGRIMPLINSTGKTGYPHAE
jgi:hypothetical protein